MTAAPLDFSWLGRKLDAIHPSREREATLVRPEGIVDAALMPARAFDTAARVPVATGSGVVQAANRIRDVYDVATALGYLCEAASELINHAEPGQRDALRALARTLDSALNIACEIAPEEV